jgi:hypothetical protein
MKQTNGKSVCKFTSLEFYSRQQISSHLFTLEYISRTDTWAVSSSRDQNLSEATVRNIKMFSVSLMLKAYEEGCMEYSEEHSHLYAENISLEKLKRYRLVINSGLVTIALQSLVPLHVPPPHRHMVITSSG